MITNGISPNDKSIINYLRVIANVHSFLFLIANVGAKKTSYSHGCLEKFNLHKKLHLKLNTNITHERNVWVSSWIYMTIAKTAIFCTWCFVLEWDLRWSFLQSFEYDRRKKLMHWKMSINIVFVSMGDYSSNIQMYCTSIVLTAVIIKCWSSNFFVFITFDWIGVAYDILVSIVDGRTTKLTAYQQTNIETITLLGLNV